MKRHIPNIDWDAVARNKQQYETWLYHSNLGRTPNSQKVTIPKRGEPLENKGCRTICHLKLFNCGTDHELNQVTLGRWRTIWKSGTRTMGQAVSFENRMGHKHTQVSKLGKAPQERQRKEGLYQKSKKKRLWWDSYLWPRKADQSRRKSLLICLLYTSV